MVQLPDPNDLSRFEAFTILTTTYKTVDSHEIKLNVIYPKNLKSPPTGSPLIFRIHGGGFISGFSLYPGFFPRHLLEFVQKHSAIIISPDYRLLPEARQSDILADIESAWQWTHSKLPNYLEQQASGSLKADLSRIITTGDSAGGYLSLQLGLSHPDQIRAVTAAYPVIDLKHPFFTTKYEKQLLDFPQFDWDQILQAHNAKMAATGTKIRSQDPNMEAVILMAAGIQHGTLLDLYFDKNDASQFPLERIEKGEKFPKGGVWVWHGEKDSVVPFEGTRKFEEALRKKDPGQKVVVVGREGADHGFDSELGIKEAGLEEVLEEVSRVWLA